MNINTTGRVVLPLLPRTIIVQKEINNGGFTYTTSFHVPVGELTEAEAREYVTEWATEFMEQWARLRKEAGAEDVN